MGSMRFTLFEEAPIPIVRRAFYSNEVNSILSIPVGSRWKISLGTGFCFFVSVIAFLTTWVGCTRHADVPDLECLQYALRNPSVVLSLFLLMILGATAVHTAGCGARKVLLWWAVLFLVFMGWFFVFS